jgi:transposase-like protein
METPIDPPAGPIIKSDRTGRTRYTFEYKQEVLDAFESSSLSAPAFAQQCGIKYPTFAAWLAKRKQGNRRPAKPTEHPSFILAELSAAPDDEVLEVRLPGGAVARAAGRDQVRLLAELLRHLA